MTKFEFIQQAALILLKAHPEGDNSGWIGDYAAILAEEVWTHEKEDAPQEPEVLTGFPEGESVRVVANEVDRVEAEWVANENEKAKAKGLRGYNGRQYRQAGGAGERFSKVCEYRANITTVAELIAFGRRAFMKLPNIGEKTLEYVDKALENLYNIKEW